MISTHTMKLKDHGSVLPQRTRSRRVRSTDKAATIAPPARSPLIERPVAAGRSPLPLAELTPDQSLQQLIEGNHRFVNHTPQNPHQSSDRLLEIAEKQKPFATILGCSDSRVPLEIIFDQGLGDVFVIRVAGNVVTPVEMGSIEYGTAVLGSKVLMVLGHANCGAVSATMKGGNLLGQMNSLIEAIQPAIARSQGRSGDALENAVQANIFWQMERLLESPVVAKLINDGQLKLVGGYYNLESGAVSILRVYPAPPPKNHANAWINSAKQSEVLSASTIRYVNVGSNSTSSIRVRNS